MRRAREVLFAIGLVMGLGLGAPLVLSGVEAPVATSVLTLFTDEAAAQTTIVTNICGNTTGSAVTGLDVFCGIAIAGDGGAGGNARADGGGGGNSGNAGDGGFSLIHDVGTADANAAASSVIAGDATTGDVNGPESVVDARGATGQVITQAAGSFGDTSVDPLAIGGNALPGTTGGNANTADSSGGNSGDAGDGGNATSRSGDGGSANGGAGGRGGDSIASNSP